MTGLRIRLNFDDDWTVLLGELDPPVPLNTAKTGSAGGAAELTLDEGGRLPIPEHLLEVIPRALLDEAIAQASVRSGEWLDANERLVPDACPVLEFTCDRGAAVIGTGNGSPADHLPAIEPRRPAFNGHALAIVRGPRSPGTFTLTATASGLRPDSLEFVAVTPA